MSFSKIEEGKLLRKGTEYDYVIEADKNDHFRLRVIKEKPVIEKVRTRYDPDITIYGDKNASMDVMLGYDIKEINKSLRFFIFTLLSPFYFAGIFILFSKWDKLPEEILPHWAAFILIPLLVFLAIILLRLYYKINMNTLAEYLKARDIINVLEKEGYKQ